MSEIKRSIQLIFFLLLACSCAHAQDETRKDYSIVRNYFNSLKTSRREVRQTGELMTKAALFLLNTPYVAHTLEVKSEETLVINLQELDCLTFVENCIALSKAAQSAVPEYDYFVNELKKIRYRGGIINGYASRLHYASEWISDNVEKGEIEDITYALGGKKHKINVGYMSSHPEGYAALKDNPQEVEKIAEIEERINAKSNYYYIPRSEINEKAALIKNGDIVGFTTTLAGLDISHFGIAYWNKGQLTFIHASSKMMKVIINPESLSEYCLGSKANTGIVVLRVCK